MSYIPVAREGDVKEGKILSIPTEYGRVALTRREGKIHAFQDLCPHDDGSLAGGRIDGKAIVCPRHGARFDIETGKVLCMPATEDIEVYPVRLRGEEVEVEVE